MYHTWFFQKRLAEALDKYLTGYTLTACFCQQKNELILGFTLEENELYMCANMAPDAGLISFKNTFARARQNSIDLFTEAVGRRVTQVSAYTHDRSFLIHLKNGFGLVFKMHGQRSNVLLTHKNHVTRIFRNNLPNDLDLIPSKLHQPMELSKPNILRLLGKRNHYLLNNESINSDYFIQQINQNSLFIGVQDDLPVLKMVSMADPVLVTDDPIQASNALVELHQRFYILGKEKQALQQRLQKEVHQLTTYISQAEMKLEEVMLQRDPQEIANLIMANLHSIPPMAKEVSVPDFYTENAPTITIKLNPNLSAQLNAQNHYRKAKNRRLEWEKIGENIASKKEQLLAKQAFLISVEKLETLKEIRAFKSTHLDKPAQASVPLPYTTYTIEGYQVLVGKNAKSNDLLTMQVASKNDLWLHARDVSGSHVIIREKPGQKFPTPVIERAAALAAWHSKRKTDSLCPVIYTPRKFVRKMKGAAAGQVVVEKEQVVMVVPFKNNA